MDIMIVVGVFVAMVSIYFGAPDVQEDVKIYLQSNAFILVLGGTLASTMISASKKEFKGLMGVFIRLLFKKKDVLPQESVQKMVMVAKKAQSANRQTLSQEAQGFGDGFLHRALEMVGAGLDKEFIDRTLYTDIQELRRRHMSLVGMVRTMGSFAPMFGMAGTVIGVIQVLKNVTDIDNVVAGMGLALLTTLYGLFLSSIIFIPLSNKLRGRSDMEVLTKEIMREGILMIIDKEIPLKVEKYLSAFLDSQIKSETKKTT